MRTLPAMLLPLMAALFLAGSARGDDVTVNVAVAPVAAPVTGGGGATQSAPTNVSVQVIVNSPGATATATQVNAAVAGPSAVAAPASPTPPSEPRVTEPTAPDVTPPTPPEVTAPTPPSDPAPAPPSTPAAAPAAAASHPAPTPAAPPATPAPTPAAATPSSEPALAGSPTAPAPAAAATPTEQHPAKASPQPAAAGVRGHRTHRFSLAPSGPPRVDRDVPPLRVAVASAPPPQQRSTHARPHRAPARPAAPVSAPVAPPAPAPTPPSAAPAAAGTAGPGGGTMLALALVAALLLGGSAGPFELVAHTRRRVPALVGGRIERPG